MVNSFDSWWSGQRSFPRMGVCEFVFQYFNGSNEGIIGG